MDGKTHLKLGITSAIATTICLGKYMNTDELILLGGLCVSSLSSIITSQLPDIDSKNSKISKIIPIVNWFKSEKFLFLSFIICFLSFILKEKIFIGYDIFFDKIINISVIMFGLYAFSKLFLKHRKLTHCLLSCLAITIVSFYPYYKFENMLLFFIGTGLATGYTSHIFYDCLTTRGCPLLYPFVDKTIKFAKLKSSKHGNIAIALSIIFIIFAILYYSNLYIPIMKKVASFV